MSPFLGRSISISLYILDEYRGNCIVNITINKIVDTYGSVYPDRKCFMVNISPYNEICNRSIKKSDWIRTYNYDEIMINEGAEFFNLYYKDNPCYEKSKIFCKKNID